jgi:hypothetical protein
MSVIRRVRSQSAGPSSPAFLLVSIWLVLAGFFLPTDTAAQNEIVVRDPAACEGCEIRLEHVVTLGDREGPGRVWLPSAMALDSRGNYYVAHGDGGYGATQIWVFDQDGTFIRIIGRQGEGPGEYRSIARIDILPGDTLEIFDAGLRRRTTLSPDLTVVDTKSFQVGRFFNSSILADGRLVVNEHQNTPERAGYPLQLVDREGKIVRSLGAVRPEFRPGEESRFQRITSSSADGESVWSVGRGDYLMELWDTTGARLAVLRRDAEWFEPFLAVSGPDPTSSKPPPPAVGLFMADSGGRLWMAVKIFSEDWREVLLADPDWATSFEALFNSRDWIIEVVDTETGELLVSQVFPDIEVGSFLGEDMLVSYRQDELGYPFLDVFRLRIHAPPHPLS